MEIRALINLLQKGIGFEKNSYLYVTLKISDMNDFGKYAYLIDEACETKNNKVGKTADNVRKILPILISWAKKGLTDKTYSDLSYEALGYKIYSGIGHPLGCIYTILYDLGKAENENIPIPNLLVNGKNSGIPSDGLSWVLKDYEGKSDEEKEEIKSLINLKTTTYKNWDWVLNMLGLKECVITPDETSYIRKAFLRGFGGEGEEHKALKNYIASNPKVLRHRISSKGITEHILLSGDRLDVFFKDENIAVEVKPKTSPEDDITRGIFQCIKYKAILDAEATIFGDYKDAEAFLVIGGKLTPKNRKIANDLGVRVYENINP